MRCFLLRKSLSEPAVRSGVIVSGRTRNAVQKNKVKRLLREAITEHHQLLATVARTAGCSVYLVFAFKVRKEMAVERMRLSHVRPDVAKCCKALAARL